MPSPESPNFSKEEKSEKVKVSPEEEREAFEAAKRAKEIRDKEYITEEEKNEALSLLGKIERIYSPGWKLEGDLNKQESEVLLAEYHADGRVLAAQFSPDGEKVVIGTGGEDKKMLVFGKN